MLTFQFGSDAKFTLIPKVGDEPIPQSEMVDLTVKIVNKNRGVNFTPLWNWNDVGIDIEIQRDQIKSATSYTVVLDWRRPDATYSDGFQDRMNYCTLIEFSRSCNIVSEDAAVIEVSPAYKGDPGDSAYQVWLDNGHEGTVDDFEAWMRQPATDAAQTANEAADKANDTANHPTYIAPDNYVYIWNKETQAYEKTDIYVKGDDGDTIINVYDNSSLRVWLSPQSEIPDEQEDGIIYIGYEDQ